MSLAVRAGQPSAEICREVRGVVLPRQPCGVGEWAAELARALVGYAEQNARTAEALRRLVTGTLARGGMPRPACLACWRDTPTSVLSRLDGVARGYFVGWGGDDTAEHTPDRLGPYRLLDRIGEGGMGVVYLARDPEQRSVAVKVLRPAVAGDPNARRRLAREVETMRRVRSPFVAEVLDTDVTSETPYIVTRYVPGRTLDEVVTQEGPLSGARLIRVAAGLADALAAIDAAGVVHRDLKPGNVMLMNGNRVVIEFGIAQALDSTRLTMTGMFMGTPGYLSPEVIEGQNSTSFSDVHAWGATVAFAATGRPPFGTGSYETIFYRIVNGSRTCPGARADGGTAGCRAAPEPAQRPAAIQLRSRAAALDPAVLQPLAVPAGRGDRPGRPGDAC